MSEPSAVERLAISGANQVFAQLQKTGRGRFSVGFHLRQAFDPTSPQLGLRTTDPDEAARIRDGMLALGVNWLNHVLDSLLYLAPGPKTGERVTNLLIDFREDLEGHHAFRFIKTEKVGRNCKRIKMEAASLDAWSLLRCRDASDVIRFLHNVPGRAPMNAWASPFDGYLCGVQKLCEEIGVRQPNLTHFRSVVAAILQVREFAQVFGEKSFTMLLRDPAVFGASAGVTIGSDREITAEEGKLVLGVLRSVLRETRDQLKKGGEEVEPKRRYRSPRPGVRSAVKGLLQPARRLSGYKVDEQISWFLDELYTCCNRKDEGRELEFGFVLGQPRMMRYWPGSQDVYLPEMTFDALMDSTYLLEPPEERVVTVPYASTRKLGDRAQGIEIMDVGAIPEQLHGGEHRGMWDGSLRPLAHLTAHYPWAVGVGVGPGSKMRVFSGGELRFIRDERGWKEYGSRLTEGDFLALKAWPNAPAEYREGVKQLLGFALQFSSNVRRHSHGALILWLPDPTQDDLKDCEKRTSALMREELEEERGGMPRQPWLKGRSLFSRTPAGGVTLDPYVARQAIRVGLADGAIVLINPTAEIWGFRRNLEFPKDKLGVKSTQEGTKRASAQAAVAHFADVKGAIAIAVRSNGPVQVFVRDRSLQDSRVVDFEAFTRVGDSDDE